MYIQPNEESLRIQDHQYLLIDQAIVGKFEGYSQYIISLAPDFNLLQAEQYPILLKFDKLSLEKQQELLDYHESFIGLYQQPIFSVLFKTRYEQTDESLAKYFKKILYVDKNGKIFLRRIYDPKVIFQLNCYESRFDILSNIFKPFSDVSIFFNKKFITFTLNEDAIQQDGILENVSFSKISLVNRLVDILNLNDRDINFVQYFSKSTFDDIEVINKFVGHKLGKFDYLALLYHVKLLGIEFLKLDEVRGVLNHDEGYFKASKSLDDENWEKIFNKLNVIDSEFKNKVMYGY